MANDFYNHSTYPVAGSAGSSALLRSELDAIAAGFDKMPAMSGLAGYLVVVNGTGTALTATNTLTGLTLNNSPIGATTASTGAFTTLTATSLTVGGLAAVTVSGAQTITGKTLSGASNTFSAIGNSSLTNSSLTIGSTSVSLGGTATTLAGLTLTAPTWTGAASGGSLSLTTALPLGSGGTGATTLSGARGALLPSYTGNAGKAFRVNAGETDVEWFAVSGTGTVTTASVVSANGFAGTVATPNTAPAITLTTSVSGMLKGAASALAAATAGTDFVAPGTATAFTAPQRPSLSAETAPTANALTWNLTTDSIVRINLNANITTLTLTGTLSSLAGYQYQAVVRYNGGTAITWPASVKFAAGTAPTLTGTSGKIDTFNFVVASNNGGTTFFLLCTGSAQNL